MRAEELATHMEVWSLSIMPTRQVLWMQPKASLIPLSYTLALFLILF